jgi:hypothetical protein
MPRKVFTPGEVLAAADVNEFLMDQAVMTFAGTAARGSAIGTATEGMLTYLADTDTFEFWDGSAYQPLAGEPPTIDVDFLVIGGGGGGGYNFGGGAGAGGYRSSLTGESSGGTAVAETALTIILGQDYEVTVGAGGAGDTNAGGSGDNGSDSVFYTVLSRGGGGGGTDGQQGQNGGSGGGAGRNSSTGAPGTVKQGFRGGAWTSTNAAAGGGGAGAVGADGTGASAGDGGAGVSSSVSGTAVTRGGGGGGGAFAEAAGAGGSGGGGAGQTTLVGGNGFDGTVNTGGGGGGGAQGANGGAGGSGIVFLRYPTTSTITIGAGLTGTTATVGSDKVTTITAGSGNVSWA